MAANVDVPIEYICPITNQLMEDPVMDREGNTFERSAISKWLERSSTSPITRSPLTAADLAPNRNLKDSIEAFRAAHAGVALNIPRPQAPVRAPLPDATLKFWQNAAGECLLSIEPPAGDPTARAPVDVVCVIDVSGSMGSAATVQNEKKEVESHGLSLLDVVKHAARTVSQILSAGDRLAIVTFSNNAKVELQLTGMDADGKTRAGKVLDALEESGQTNLWDGLQTAMDLLKNNADPARSKSVFLLTDGCPNVEPPRGHLPTMKQYIDRLGGVAPFTVNTFGFGYSLDSVVLNDLAREAGGMYVFIPDSGLVGTVFVNCVANLLTTLSSSVSVSVESEVPITDALNLVPTRFGAFGSIGGLQYGQTRDVYFRASGASPTGLFAKVEYTIGGVTKTLTATAQPAGPLQAPLFVAHQSRNRFCAEVSASFAAKSKAQAEALAKQLAPLVDTHPLVKALSADLAGEVTLAFKADNFDKWGRHYVPSLVRANELQQCNNFKDKSVQQYGSAFFASVRDQGEAIFIKLPPPTASRQAKTPTAVASAGGRGGGARGGAACAPPRAAAPVQMRAYYNCGGGCVAPDSLVSMADGTTTRADAVRKGDVLLGGARVLCTVRILAPKESEGLEMVTVKGGLVISAYHPIRLGGEWVFPTQCAQLVERRNRPDLQCIYNFVLDQGHTAVVNGVEMCTLGHSFAENEVVRHEFFGSPAVVTALSGLDGYGDGFVTVTRFTRNPATNRVCGLEGQ